MRLREPNWIDGDVQVAKLLYSYNLIVSLMHLQEELALLSRLALLQGTGNILWRSTSCAMIKVL